MMCSTSPQLRPFRLQNLPPERTAGTPAAFIHTAGILLFLFIPLVLFLFLRFPLGVGYSFILAITIIAAHRFASIPFMNRFRKVRCLWCGRTSRALAPLAVQCGNEIEFQFCNPQSDQCLSNAKRFFDFCSRYKVIFRIGIFLPLVFYLIAMILGEFGVIHIPVEWGRFIFQFFIACSVVAISFFYRLGNENTSPSFPFPIHNLFLLGIRNTLLIFRYVGIWWIIAGLIFLYFNILK